jgi:threonylcarbamoyladenosine tRNA methylthiotransferase MtaB
MKIAFKTFGCRLNISETESIISQVQAKEDISNDIDEADIVVINTCTVTSEAEKKSIRLINQLLKEGKFCISTGCFDPTTSIKNEKLIYLSLDYKGKVNEIIEKIENLFYNNKINLKDFTFNNLDKIELLKNIDSDSFNYNKRFLNPALDKRFHSRAFLKIQDGCNNNCSYCKVHIVRGKEVSLNYEQIIDSLNKISDAGFKEVVLTGINIAKYSYNNLNFSSLLQNLLNLFPDLIFQISSIEINNLDEKFFEIIKNKNIKPYFHLPLQSGSNKILSLMNRQYKVDDYLKVLNKIKENRKDAFLSTDIIVGFPGEDKKTISETESVVLSCGFHHLHLFPFSKREGTSAFYMQETMEQSEKSYYIDRLNHIVKGNKKRYLNSFIGKNDYFIVEKVRKSSINQTNIISGKSYHNLIVNAYISNRFQINKGDYLQIFIFGKEKNELMAMIL